MSDMKPQPESLESLLSTAIGLLMGHKERIGYKPDSVIAKFVNECVERLKDWPYTDEAQPAITSEPGNQAAQGASAITSESAQAEHDCDCGRKWKHMTYGWASTEPAQAGALLTYEEIAAEIRKRGQLLNGVAGDRFIQGARWAEQAVRSKLGAGVPMTDAQIAEFQEDGVFWQSCKHIVRDIEKFHGIVGKEGA